MIREPRAVIDRTDSSDRADNGRIACVSLKTRSTQTILTALRVIYWGTPPSLNEETIVDDSILCPRDP